jgi:hypothetical protein
MVPTCQLLARIFRCMFCGLAVLCFVESIIWAESNRASSFPTLTSGKLVQQCSNEAHVRC